MAFGVGGHDGFEPVGLHKYEQQRDNISASVLSDFIIKFLYEYVFDSLDNLLNLP